MNKVQGRSETGESISKLAGQLISVLGCQFPIFSKRNALKIRQAYPVLFASFLSAKLLRNPDRSENKHKLAWQLISVLRCQFSANEML